LTLDPTMILDHLPLDYEHALEKLTDSFDEKESSEAYVAQ
jgi:hypothetical protein